MTDRTTVEMPLLTDDEIVALSARLQATWRTVLPTVDLEVPEALIAAAARGTRSLYVRGLFDIDSDTFDESLHEAFQRVSARPVRIAVYAMDAEGLMLPGTAAQYYFAAPEDDPWIWDGIAAGGVHTFGTSTPSQAREVALEAIQDVLTSGVGGSTPEQPLALALVSQLGARVRQLQVTQGAVAAFQQGPDGTPVQMHLGGLEPGTALAWLLEVP